MSLKTAFIIVFIFVEFFLRIIQLGIMGYEITDFWVKIVTFYTFAEMSVFIVFSAIAGLSLFGMYLDIDSKGPKRENKISKKIDKDS